MTTQVKIEFAQNPHDWETHVIARDTRDGGERTEAVLSEQGQSHVATIWDGKELVIREVRKEG